MRRFIFWFTFLAFVLVPTVGFSWVRCPAPTPPPVKPWGQSIINNQSINPTFNTTQFQSASAVATGGQGGAGGSVTAPVTGNFQGAGSPSISMNFEAVPDFPGSYVTQPAAPLHYFGPYPTSYYDDQPWFKRKKWMADEITTMPNGGKISHAIYNKTEAVKYVQPRDGRELNYPLETLTKAQQEKQLEYKRMTDVLSGMTWHGPVYCDTDGPNDKNGIMWGGCARKLAEKGCTVAWLISGTTTHAARSSAVNQSVGASLAGIFGSLFGFNVGGGASNTDHTAGPYQETHLVWDCYGLRPQVPEAK